MHLSQRMETVAAIVKTLCCYLIMTWQFYSCVWFIMRAHVHQMWSRMSFVAVFIIVKKQLEMPQMPIIHRVVRFCILTNGIKAIKIEVTMTLSTWVNEIMSSYSRRR